MNNKKIFILLGIFGYVFSVIGIRIIPNYNYSTDYALPHILFSASVVVFFTYFVKIKNEKISKYISVMAKYTFSAYMIHYIVIYYIPYYLFPGFHIIYQYFIVALLVYIVSILLAIIIDNTIVRICQNIFDEIANRIAVR